MYDLECPYCGNQQDVCHDDGFGYEEDKWHEVECEECEKTFVFETGISFYYSPKKADCLNGETHRLTDPRGDGPWPKAQSCQDCDYEIQGEYDPSYLEGVKARHEAAKKDLNKRPEID